MERVYALKEMFPDCLQTLFQNFYYYSNYLGQIMKKSIWFCTSSMIVLLLPILFTLEFSQFNEMEAAQTREVKSNIQKNFSLVFLSLSTSFFLVHQLKLDQTLEFGKNKLIYDMHKNIIIFSSGYLVASLYNSHMNFPFWK